jgi:hypothetical protein
MRLGSYKAKGYMAWRLGSCEADLVMSYLAFQPPGILAF